MAQSSSAAHQIASRYAGALIDTAQQAGALDSVEKDMSELSAMLGSSEDLQKLIASPVFAISQQEAALLAIAKAASFSKHTINFLQVLSGNRRLPALKIILAAFREEISRRRGEVKASVRSALALTPEQERNLQDELKKSLGFKVQLEMSVDKSLLGGMVVTVGSKQIDDSVKSKLASLKKTLTTSNQNAKNLKEVG